jgi:hypothetical protein
MEIKTTPNELATATKPILIMLSEVSHLLRLQAGCQTV